MDVTRDILLFDASDHYRGGHVLLPIRNLTKVECNNWLRNLSRFVQLLNIRSALRSPTTASWCQTKNATIHSSTLFNGKDWVSLLAYTSLSANVVIRQDTVEANGIAVSCGIQTTGAINDSWAAGIQRPLVSFPAVAGQRALHGGR